MEVQGCRPTEQLATHGGSGLPATRAACHPWRFWAAGHPSSLPPMEVPGCWLTEQLATHGGSGLPATRVACHPWKPTETARLPLSTPVIMHCQTTQDQYADPLFSPKAYIIVQKKGSMIWVEILPMTGNADWDPYASILGEWSCSLGLGYIYFSQ